MKITVLQDAVNEPELVVRCRDADAPEIKELLKLVGSLEEKIPVKYQGELILLSPAEVLYAEFVDRNVFLYTKDGVYLSTFSLLRLEMLFSGFFRCSKSMVVNLHHISRLKSGSGGRIAATLSNGEKILISRHYASALRETLSVK